MKIIYDEAKTTARKQQIEQTVQETNFKIHKKNMIITAIVWSIAIILGAAAIVIFYPMITEMLNEGAGNMFHSAMCVLGYVAVPGTFYLAAEGVVAMATEEHLYYKYPPDVEYYIAIQDKNVLKVDFKPAKIAGKVALILTYEDENHIVCTQDVCWLTCKQSTAVTEDTADLENGLYLMPYNEEKE